MMTAEQLKNSILQLALQGRLVEQSTEDESAQKLLERIRAAKKALIKAGTVPKDKKVEEISEDDQLFDLPENWSWTRMGELFQHNTGKALNGTNKDGEVLTYITTSNLYWNRFELDNLKSMPFTESEVEKCTVTKGDLLVCEGGDYGRAAIWNYDFDMRIQNHVHRLRAYLPLCTEYFYYVINFLKGTGLIKGKGIAIQGLSSGALHNLAVPLPPFEEQRRIVAKIEELMPFVEQYAKASTRLNTLNTSFPEQMKKSILQQAVMGKLVPQDPNDEPASVLLMKIAEEKQNLIKEGKIKKQKASNVVVSDDKPFEIPESWAWATLADLAKQITDGEHSTPKRSTKFDGYYLLSARNVRDGSIQLTDVDYIDKAEFDRISSRCNPTRGDILISCSGSVGRCTVVDDDNKYVMVRSAAMVSPVMCNPKYLMYAIQSECVQQQINGMKKQTAQANLFLGAISVLMIPVPPIAEQNRIVGKLEDTFKHIEGSLKDSIQ